jgi:O-antigen ligase
MLTVGHQKIEAPTLLLVSGLVAVAAVMAVAVPALMPWTFVAVAGAGLMLVWVLKWDVTLWAWIYVLSYGLLDWPEWRVIITGFFNMTVPRFIFLGAMLSFGAYFLLHRVRIRFDRGVLWAMLGLTICVAASATATGWVSTIQAIRFAPYFRFLGSILFPFVIFFLMYNATNRQSQIRSALLLLTFYGWYALYISYLQFAAMRGVGGAWDLIWPAYIKDANYGIHFLRGRGAFESAPPQAVLMVLLFYTDLFLIRKIRGPYRLALIVQAILCPPAVFFAGMRSGYVAFILCGAVWCLWANRGRFGKTRLVIAAMVVVVGAAMFWSNLMQEDREKGGIMQTSPVYARLALLQQTWEIFQQHPIVGVGFGHFCEAQQQLQRSPATLAGATVGILVEHNLFLNMAAETGLIGLLLTIAVFWLMYRQSAQLWGRLPATGEGYLCREFVVLFWVAMLNFLVDATFRDPLWDNFNNGLFWTLAGLVAGYNRLLEPHPLDQPPALPAVIPVQK